MTATATATRFTAEARAEADARRADFKFWLDGVRFWAASLELASDEESQKRAMAGMVRCHQIVTDYLDKLVDDRLMEQAD